MKYLKILIPGILILVITGCATKNISLSHKDGKKITTLFISIPDVPRPKASIQYSRMIGGVRSVLYYDLQEGAKIENTMGKSDFRTLLASEFSKKKLHINGINTVLIGELTEKSKEDIKKNLNQKNPLKNNIHTQLSRSPYVLFVTINDWGYNYYSYGPFCNYYVDMTAEIINMATGTVIWRTEYDMHDYGTFRPANCDLTGINPDKDLTWMAKKIAQDIIQDLKK